jgi:hypothetical protein
MKMQKILSLTIVFAILAWTVSLNAAHATCRGYPDYGCDSVNEWANTYYPPQQQSGQFNQNNSTRAQQLDQVQQRVQRHGF